MLNATRDLVLPTTITGSYPGPAWFTEGLHRRPFKDALGHSVYREQYLDAVSCLIGEQVRAGLDIVTYRDSRYRCVAITLGEDLARRELGLPEAPAPAADPRFA